MEKEVSKITKVEIKKLWGRYDLVWNLHPDVNVLSGINGSGKSTILKIISDSVSKLSFPDRYSEIIDEVEIFFNENKFISGNCMVFGGSPSFHHNFSYEFNEEVVEELNEKLPVSAISTFDTEILDIGKPDKVVRTVLDREIFALQKRYLDFQLNIAKKVIEAISKGNNAHTQEEVAKIRQQQERFLEIIDHLFKDTDKKINRQKNEIMFLFGNKELTPYQLSSGEKQILVILLTLLVQDNQNAIVFLDEPEVSLHFDWQKKLIQYMRELNPNAQIIIATHSPALIIEGWRDKVTNVKDIIVKDHSKSAN
jgi:predicted ATPase